MDRILYAKAGSYRILPTNWSARVSLADNTPVSVKWASDSLAFVDVLEPPNPWAPDACYIPLRKLSAKPWPAEGEEAA